MIEVVLAIFAWQKGWKALALIPVGVAVAIGFVAGFVSGYLGFNTALAAVIIFIIVDIPCIAVLIFMICRAPKKVRLANAENAWNYSPGNAYPAPPAQNFNAPRPPAQNFNAPIPPVGAGEVIFCTYCGKELKVGIARCDACGQKID